MGKFVAQLITPRILHSVNTAIAASVALNPCVHDHQARVDQRKQRSPGARRRAGKGAKVVSKPEDDRAM
eukprot:11207845-Lingulodinium_polyedra.AAC.1